MVPPQGYDDLWGAWVLWAPTGAHGPKGTAEAQGVPNRDPMGHGALGAHRGGTACKTRQSGILIWAFHQLL